MLHSACWGQDMCLSTHHVPVHTTFPITIYLALTIWGGWGMCFLRCSGKATCMELVFLTVVGLQCHKWAHFCCVKSAEVPGSGFCLLYWAVCSVGTELKVAIVSRLFRHSGTSPELLSHRHEDRGPTLEGTGKVMSSLCCPGMSPILWCQVSDGYKWFPDQLYGREHKTTQCWPALPQACGQRNISWSNLHVSDKIKSTTPSELSWTQVAGFNKSAC